MDIAFPPAAVIRNLQVAWNPSPRRASPFSAYLLGKNLAILPRHPFWIGRAWVDTRALRL
jgi:hypothetical protein